MRTTNALENIVVLLASGERRSLRSIAVEGGLGQAAVRRTMARRCRERSISGGGLDGAGPRGVS